MTARFLSSLVALLVVVGAAGAAVRITGGSEAAHLAPRTVAAGDLRIVTSGDTQSLEIPGLVPGRPASADVAVANDGGDAASVSLRSLGLEDTAGPYGGFLSPRLELRIARADTGAPIYTGPLADFETADLGALPSGQQHPLRFTVTLPDTGIPPTPTTGDNAVQGASTKLELRYTAYASETVEPEPVDPTGSTGEGTAPLTPNPDPNPNTPAPPPDTRVLGQNVVLKPAIQLTRLKRPLGIKARRVRVVVRCYVTCKYTARLLIRKRNKKLHKTRMTVRGTIRGGGRRVIIIRTKKKLLRVARRKGRYRVLLHANVVDHVGNKAAKQRKMKVKRPRQR